MPIVGFGFNKITVEKKAPVKGKINIKTSVAITSVEKTELNLGPMKGKIAKFNFEFTANYEPKIADIVLKGEILYFDKEDAVDKIIEGWNKDKKVPKEIMADVINYILGKCSVEALVLGKDMGLPPAVQLPKVAVKT